MDARAAASIARFSSAEKWNRWSPPAAGRSHGPAMDLISRAEAR